MAVLEEIRTPADCLDRYTVDKTAYIRTRTLTDADFLAMRIPRRFWASDLNLVPSHVRRGVAHYMNDVPTVCAGGTGMLFFGGAGKTSAATVVLKHLRAHLIPALFLSASEITDGSKDRERFPILLTRVRTVPALLIDNYSYAEGLDKFFGEARWEALVREREANLLITLMTTLNLPSFVAAWSAQTPKLYF